MEYDFLAIEKKWQKRWKDEKPFRCEDRNSKPKFYGLVEFPYPSAQGLHVGHTRPYTAMDVVALVLMLSPFAPHISEELWELGGYPGQACLQPWPKYDPMQLLTDTVQMAVQVAGKVKATITTPADASDEEVIQAALSNPKVKKLAEEMTLVKSIVVKGKLVSLIFKSKS